jgi:hypothetical protein
VFEEGEQAASCHGGSERDPELHDLFFSCWFRSGLRPGEGRALAWKDIDFTKRKIHVEFNVSDKGEFGETKTGMGAALIFTRHSRMFCACGC